MHTVLYFVTFRYMGDEIEGADPKFIGVVLDPQTVEDLDRIAAETFRTRAGLVRLAISQLIEADKAEAKEARA